MNLNNLEKERQKKILKNIKDKIELVKLEKEIRQNNEGDLKEKIGVQRSLEKFHKPVIKELEKYEKSNKDIVNSIQNAFDNISFPTLESSRIPEIDYEPSYFEKLFQEKSSAGTQTALTKDDIVYANPDEGIDQNIIKEYGLKLPSELWYENLEVLTEQLNKALGIKEDLKYQLASSSSAVKRTKKPDKKEEHLAKGKKNKHISDHLSLYIDALNTMAKFKEKIGKGIDGLDYLDKLTDKICKSGKVSKKMYKEIVLVLNSLLRNETITDADAQRYYNQFLC